MVGYATLSLSNRPTPLHLQQHTYFGSRKLEPPNPDETQTVTERLFRSTSDQDVSCTMMIPDLPQLDGKSFGTTHCTHGSEVLTLVWLERPSKLAPDIVREWYKEPHVDCMKAIWYSYEPNQAQPFMVRTKNQSRLFAYPNRRPSSLDVISRILFANSVDLEWLGAGRPLG
jgi:hypothetical protein